MTPLLVLTGIVGLGIGIWLGMPGRYSQTSDDIERIMEEGGVRRRGLKARSVNPLAWMHRKASPRAPSRARMSGPRRSGFSLEAPDED